MTKTLHVVRIRDGIVETLNNDGEFINKHTHCLEEVWEQHKDGGIFRDTSYGTMYFVSEVDPMTGATLFPYRYHEVWICQRGWKQRLKIVGDRESGMIGDDNVVVIMTTVDGLEYGFVDSLFGDSINHSPYYGDAIAMPCTNLQEAAAVNRILEKLANGVTLSVPLVMKREGNHLPVDYKRVE